MKLARRLLWILAAATAAYALLGFFVLPAVLRAQLPKALTKALHRPVAVGRLAVNPFALSCTVRDLVVGEKSGPEKFFSLGELYVNLESSSVWKRGLVIREVRLSKPFARIERTEPGVYNFSDLLTGSAKKPEPAKPSAPLRFSVGNIQILEGSGEFFDRPRGTQHSLAALRLTLPFISNLPAFLETFVDPRLQATVDGRSVTLKGESKPFADSLETSADVELKDFDIPKYVEYLPFQVSARLSSAVFGLRTHISYVQYRDKGPSLALSGDVSLRNVILDDAKRAPLLRLPLATVAFAPVNVFGRSAKITSVRVEGVDLQVSHRADGRWNWSALLPETEPSRAEAEPPAPQEETKEATAAKPFLYQIDEAAIARAKIAFEDLTRAKPFRTVVAPLDLSLRNVSNVAGRTGDVSLSLSTEASETVELKGSVSLTPVKSEGTLKVGSVRLAKYAPFYDTSVRFGLKGVLDLASRYAYEAKPENPETRLSGLSVSLSSVEAKRPEEPEPFFRAPSLLASDTEVDLTKKSVVLGKVVSQKAALNLIRPDGGAWNVTQLTPPPEKPVPPPPSAKSKTKGRAAKSKEEKPSGPPWTVKVVSLAVRDLGVRVTDDEPDDTARLSFSKISVDASNLSTAPKTQGKLALSAALNKKGNVSAKGTVSLSPVTAALAVNLKSAELTPFQPYLAKKLNAFITDGAISANGNVTLGAAPSPQSAAPVTFGGGFLVSDFSMDDEEGAEEIAQFKTLSFTGVDLRTEPLVVKIDGISLSDFAGAVAIEPDGTLNLRDIVAQETPAQPTGAQPAPVAPPRAAVAASPPVVASPAPKIEVKTVTLQGGKVRFTDRHIKPAYTANLEELGGRVSGLTSQQGVLADVDLRASLNGYSPIEITGRVNPLQKDPFVDLRAAVKGMDMSTTTPYSGRYLGYTIQQGKLFLDVRYHIDQRKLDSQNVVVFDRLTLGDKVESPDATKIPVRFGLALLTDRNGQIHLDVPIDGNLDDPTFHIGKVIWNVVINLLAKAVTSPFSALGSLFGGGEELGFVDFTPGSAALGAPGLKKVESLSKALRERPALRLEVLGRTDPERDLDALKELLYTRKLKTQKAKELLKTGESVADVDDLTLTKEETPRLVALAYKAEKFPKPKNWIGLDKDLPPAEMEKLIRSHLQVGNDDLRLLASQRANAVREAFAKTGLVEPERIFLIEGDKQTKEQAAKPPAPRVEFALK